MTQRKAVWRLLTAFAAVALVATALGLAANPAADTPDTALGWIVVVAVTLSSAVALLVLNSRWFFSPPRNIRGALMTGIFMRLAVAELVFVVGYVLYMTDVADATAPMAGLVVSAVLVMLFVAPTASNLERIQEQLNRTGVVGDVVEEMSRPFGS